MRRTLLVVLGLAASAVPAAAQGSAFALRGLGWAGRPVSARSAGFGGALGALDPEMSVNPATLARWRSVAGWAVAAPTRREFDGVRGPAENQTVRFPLIGFATSVRSRLGIGFSFSDYLDRTFKLTVVDTMVINGTPESYLDQAQSLGGVSDVQLGVGYRLRPSLLVGAGFHYYLGSVRLQATRTFDNVAYLTVVENSITDYRGMGFGVGLVFQPSPAFDVGLSGRVNGNLRAENLREQTVLNVPLAHEAALGARLQIVPGVSLAGTAQWAGWSRANDVLPQASGGARDTWALSGGVEIQRVTLIKLRTPLRGGYRYRQLPFLSLGENVDEQAWSFGFGFSFGQERANLDFAYEQGTRAAGTTEERFTTGFVGLTIRP